MEINIIGISVIAGSGPDFIYCHTDMPAACYPFNNTVSFKIMAGKGMGVEYVRKHFPNIPMNYVEESKNA